MRCPAMFWLCILQLCLLCHVYLVEVIGSGYFQKSLILFGKKIFMLAMPYLPCILRLCTAILNFMLLRFWNKCFSLIKWLCAYWTQLLFQAIAFCHFDSLQNMFFCFRWIEKLKMCSCCSVLVFGWNRCLRIVRDWVWFSSEALLIFVRKGIRNINASTKCGGNLNNWVVYTSCC